MTGLIYVVIIALWAAVLIPIWLRRHDQVSQTRSTEKFSSAMKSLAVSSSAIDVDTDSRMRSRAMHPAQRDHTEAMARYGQRDEHERDQRRRSAVLERDNAARVAAERHDVHVSEDLDRGRRSKRTAEDDRSRRTQRPHVGAPALESTPSSASPSYAEFATIVRTRARQASRRRVLIASLLLVATVGTAVAWIAGYAPQSAIVIPGGLLAVYVVAALASAPARASRRRALLALDARADARPRGDRRERARASAHGHTAWDPREANIPASVVGSAAERERRTSQPAARAGRRAGLAPDLLESAQAVRSRRRAPSRVTFDVDEHDQDTASVPAIRGYVDGLRRAANDS